MINQEHICWYLDRGLDLIPLRGKQPAHKAWRTRTYTEQTLQQWKGNLGWRLGPNDVVLDVDPRRSGNEALERLSDVPRDTVRVRTGSGGLHIYLRKSPDCPRLRVELPEYRGVELKTLGSQVVIAGSVHPETKQFYEFVSDTQTNQFAELPQSLIGLYAVPESSDVDDDIITPEQLAELLAQLPVEEYNDHGSWFAILAASVHATDGDGLGEFLEWSLSDPSYANQESTIRARWASLARGGYSQRGLGTLIRAAKQHGGKGLPAHTSSKIAENYKALLDLAPVSAGLRQKSGDLRQLSANSGQDMRQLIGPTQYDPGTYLADVILREQYEDGRLLCFGSDDEFWRYNGKFWEPRSRARIENEIYPLALDYCRRVRAKKANIPSLIAATIAVLRARVATGLDPIRSAKTRHPLINVLNGTVELNGRTGTAMLRKHCAEDELTTLIDVDYDPNATCPLAQRTFEEIFSLLPDWNAVVNFIWEVLGYTIQPVKNIPAWFLLFGGGDNGKTMLFSVLGALLGPTLVSKGMHEFQSDKHAYSDLVGALAVVDDDLKAHTVLQDDFLKKITENKSLSANPKFKPAFNFLSTATVFMASNHWPQSRDLSNGMLRRAYVIPFTRKFLDSEKDLDRAKRIIDSELSGVLAASLRGLQRLRQRGRFDVPESCKAAAKRWVQASNQVAVFEADYYERTDEPLDMESFEGVWEQYKVWCMASGKERRFSRHRLIEALRSYGWAVGSDQCFMGVRRKV